MVRLKDGERLSFASESTSVQDMKSGKAKLVKVSSNSASPSATASQTNNKNPDFPPHYIQPMVQQALAKGLLVCGTLR